MAKLFLYFAFYYILVHITNEGNRLLLCAVGIGCFAQVK